MRLLCDIMGRFKAVVLPVFAVFGRGFYRRLRLLFRAFVFGQLPRTQLLGIQRTNSGFARTFFQLQAGGFGGFGAFCGYLCAGVKTLGLAHQGNVGGGHFGQHIQHQLGIGHVVGQVFLL